MGYFKINNYYVELLNTLYTGRCYYLVGIATKRLSSILLALAFLFLLFFLLLLIFFSNLTNLLRVCLKKLLFLPLKINENALFNAFAH